MMRHSFIFSVAGSRVCCSQSPFLLRTHESKRETQEMKSNSEGGGRLLYGKKASQLCSKLSQFCCWTVFFLLLPRKRTCAEFRMVLHPSLAVLTHSWVLGLKRSQFFPDPRREESNRVVRERGRSLPPVPSHFCSPLLQFKATSASVSYFVSPYLLFLFTSFSFKVTRLAAFSRANIARILLA